MVRHATPLLLLLSWQRHGKGMWEGIGGSAAAYMEDLTLRVAGGGLGGSRKTDTQTSRS